jgi:RNA polymerase sigma-70 factor (ECF subfamily)
LEENLQSSVGRASLRAVAGQSGVGSSGASPHQSLDIAALARAMADGDETAYRLFYDAYFDRLLRYLLVVTGGNEEAAREALQLALVRVVRHVKAFEAEEKFWSWLTVLARSALADESRKRRRYFAFLEKFTRQQETGPAAMDNGEADEQLRALLESKLTALPEDERQLVEQKYILHRSVREIAGGQQTTEKAVESRLSRVRRKLKDAVLAELKNERAN